MIHLTLPYPISANRYWAVRVIPKKPKPLAITYVTEEAKNYKAAVGLLANGIGPQQFNAAGSTALIPSSDNATVFNQLGMTAVADVTGHQLRIVAPRQRLLRPDSLHVLFRQDHCQLLEAGPHDWRPCFAA